MVRITEEEFEAQMMEDMKEEELDGMDEQQQDQMEDSEAWKDAYGHPEQEEKHNQHTFLASSLLSKDTEKVTYLQESELGRPLFNVRFLLDIEDISKFYLDKLSLELGLYNNIAIYFREKINNICSSGMSNKGFVQNLNVTKKMESTRERIKNLPPLNNRGKLQRG